MYLPKIPKSTPVLRRIDDIGVHFPICWKRTGNNMYSLEFHKTQLRELARREFISEEYLRSHILQQLNIALHQNGWIVYPVGKYPSSIICYVNGCACSPSASLLA
jgi:hypothetical protein